MKILYLPGPYSQQRQRDVKAKIYPVLMAMEATFRHQCGHEVYWNDRKMMDKVDWVCYEPEDWPFLDLPRPDRILTQAMKYQDNGNFKYLPATYMQASRDCWYGKCSFCAWAKRYQYCMTRTVYSVLSEVQECADQGYREIFDDSGTFPVGSWLRDFCRGMIALGLNRRIRISCNMRFGALGLEDFELMKKAGFRMILWGLESVNDTTLVKLNKGIRLEQAITDLAISNNFGFWNHVAVMFGYFWETWADEQRTYEFVRTGLLNNKIQSVQASVYRVPGDPINIAFGEFFRKKVYRIYLHPQYIKHRLKEIRSWDDVKYLLRSVKKVVMK